MHWLDITLLVVLAIGAILGARSGLLWQIARLVSFGIALYVCIYYHEPAASFLATYLADTAPAAITILAHVATFIVVYLVLHCFTLLLQRGLKVTRLKTLDRILGAGFGCLKVGLLAGAALMGMAIYATPQTDATLAESRLAPPLLQGMRAVTVAVPQEYKDELNTSLERIQQVGVEKAGQLSDAAARKSLEEQLRSLPPTTARSRDSSATR